MSTAALPPKQFTIVDGHCLAHVEMGSGDPHRAAATATPPPVTCGWPNQQEVTVAGLPFIQEDSGAAIGDAVAAWLFELD